MKERQESPVSYSTAGTDRYDKIMSTRKGLRAVARWAMSEGVLGQFSIAKEQADRAEGRTQEGESEVAGE